MDPVDLPSEAESDLPPLPERESTGTQDAEDELLGGADGN
jgi:hypothetical protein